jgi:hypothetical protein
MTSGLTVLLVFNMIGVVNISRNGRIQ